jgi:hypothetical protein
VRGNKDSGHDLWDDVQFRRGRLLVGCHYSAGSVVGFKRDENGKPLHDPATGALIPVYGERANFGQTGNADYDSQFQFKARQKQPTQSSAPAKK